MIKYFVFLLEQKSYRFAFFFFHVSNSSVKTIFLVKIYVQMLSSTKKSFSTARVYSYVNMDFVNLKRGKNPLQE